MIDILEEWGKWSRHDWGSYSSPLYHLMRAHNPDFRTGDAYAPDITDDEAMRVSAIVCDLARHNKVLAEVLKRRYINNMSLRQISRYYLTPLEYPAQASLSWHDKKKKRVHPQVTARLLEEAEKYVRSRL